MVRRPVIEKASGTDLRPAPAVAAAGVHLGYGGDDVVHGVDLVVARGESTALVGPSGSGKSTLLYGLAGLVPITTGEIEIAGHRLSSLDEEQRSAVRRSAVGLVFQFGELVPELTLVENVALPLRLLGRSRRTARRAALEGLARLGVADLAERRPGQVSGGQAQRAAIARAVIHEPAVVLADEPTGALDSVRAGEVCELLLEVVGEQGAGLVLVTHDEHVASVADRIVRLVDGRLEPLSGARCDAATS